MSLLLFLIPTAFTTIWHIVAGHKHDLKALLATAITIAVLGTLCDIIFGYTFFTFPNEGAASGIRVRSWNWAEMTWVRGYLPIEEFGFYILGGFFMISTYLWADHHWVTQYSADQYGRMAKAHPKLLDFSWRIVLLAESSSSDTSRPTTTKVCPGG